MEQASGSSHDGVARLGLLLVAHAQVAARTLQIQDVVVAGTSLVLRVVIVEQEPGVLRQHVPIAFGLQFVDDVVGRGSDHKRCLEFDLAMHLF